MLSAQNYKLKLLAITPTWSASKLALISFAEKPPEFTASVKIIAEFSRLVDDLAVTIV